MSQEDKLISSSGPGILRTVEGRGSKKGSPQVTPPSQTPIYNYPATVESVRHHSSLKWQSKVTSKAQGAGRGASQRLEAMVGRGQTNHNPTVWGHSTLGFSGEEWPPRSTSPQPQGSGISQRSSMRSKAREGESMEGAEGGEEEAQVYPYQPITTHLKQSLASLLDPPHQAGKDWKHLATLLGLGAWVTTLGSAPSPTTALLTLAEVNNTNLEVLRSALGNMGRGDIIYVIQQVTQGDGGY